jgi:N-acetylglucosamine malate deacetylase 1
MTASGLKTLIVDLCDGEPADYAEPGTRRKQALAAAGILGADRVFLGSQDRFIVDHIPTRLEIACMIRIH